MDKFATWVVCLQALNLVACAHVSAVTQPTGTPASVAMTEESQITFWVSRAVDSRMLPGVKVTLVSHDGSELELGETGASGSLRVLKSVLREHEVRIVLFSHEHFFTGAFRAEELDLESNRSIVRLIDLAAFAVP
jgi:hypothetical protein